MTKYLPEAIFDILYLGKNLQKKIEDFSLYEIQTFSYLSCLLSLYDGNPASDWNYVFIKSSKGGPYSLDLANSFSFLTNNDFIRASANNYFNLTEKGDKYLENYYNLISFEIRKKYLETSIKSISIIPASLIKNAIKNEPLLMSANNTDSIKTLIDEESYSLKFLYNQFASLRYVINGKYKSLIIPAVLWLESLSNKEELYDS
ncbi:MAG: hypothetical protein R2776_05370 [Flavobacteriaceae bacterium]